ncbi:protein MALE DISCOVERER 2-like [Senna tora]|uniref:Protein MALE DISCOVERER 2-like n=1 Tax=Senna tora TaxID=362788 RepID=A0A834X9S1_9FABA|nr:protein MALE DISCOVERER 2-like [Senna tora]
MGIRCNQIGLWFKIYIALISLWKIRVCLSLNNEGLALLEFRDRITFDPYGALSNWNPNDCDPCEWLGVHCVDGKVQMLDLNTLSLEGTLAPELGKLNHLKSLVLYKNNLSGTIPKELGSLAKLELLDLRDNNLTGSIPVEIKRTSLLLKHLLICGNKIEGSVCPDIGEIKFPFKWLFLDNCTSPLTSVFGCMNRKFGNCVWQRNYVPWKKADSIITQIKGALVKYLNALALPVFKLDKAPHGYEENVGNNSPSSHETEIAQSVPTLVNSDHRRLLDQSSNLVAAPISVGPTKPIISFPTTLSSGSFPAVSVAKKENQSSTPPLPSDASNQSQSSQSSAEKQTSQDDSAQGGSKKLWIYVIIIISIVAVLVIIVAIFCLWQTRSRKAISPWKTGISGQLQKAFITGVPKLNRNELETACEDFSNIIDNLDGCTIYKGTLSSGVEIAVASTIITSSKEWSKNSEMGYRKRINTLSRINHKNFINLIGFCEEEEPFTRMMVFEYAPNGTLFDHLHVKDDEHLDWSARTRIIMGIAYCLQYMHHDLNPPIAHTNLSSSSIYLTDDFAAKAAEMTFGKQVASKTKASEENGSSQSELPPTSDPETNVYNFGILLLEIISGKLPYSEEQGHLTQLAAEYLNDKRSISGMIDPTLQSFKNEELDVIWEVIQDCIKSDPRLRPTMKDILSKLRGVINISPEQAVPRLSPLWWAELEILSSETN